jgi:S-adenosyl-L-methionine hydrolase (adenosine-forming)
MRIVTLISDWNSADYYIGAIKGRILGSCPDTLVVDINHQIVSHNINQAAFVLKNSYKNFPEGTIHIIAVQSEATKEKPFAIVKYEGHYFIGADNGLFFLSMDPEPHEIVAIKDSENPGSFPELDVFANAAIALINDKSMDKIGEKRDKVYRQLPFIPTIDESVLVGKVIYIDSFQNVITNIDKTTFEKVGQNRIFTIYVQSKGNRITRINKSYNETSEGELLAIFNSAGYLEIAIRNGKIAELFNLTTNSSVRIVFDEKKVDETAIQNTLF